MSGHTTPWPHHHHQEQHIVRNLGQLDFRQPPPPPTPPPWTTPTTMRSPVGHPQAGTVHVGPHARHDMRPGHHHTAPNLYGQVPRPGHHHAAPNLYGQVPRPGHHHAAPNLYGQVPRPGLGYHDPRSVHTPGQMNGFSVTPEVITASPHDAMIQENKINQAIALVNKDKVPMPSGPNLLTRAIA